MSKTILCNISDHLQVIEEERQRWVLWVLINLKIPESVIENYNNIDVYRHELDKRGIEVDYNISNGQINVYKKKFYNSGKISGWLDPTEDNLIGQWKRPRIIKKLDSNGPYYEMQLREWSIFGIYN